MKLSLLLVSYQSFAPLRACLQSVEKAMTRIPGGVEVIVVDNASTDRTPELLAPVFPFVKWVVNTGNTGFSRACNQGFARCSGEYALFLNPDTVIPEDGLIKPLEFLSAHPGIGALGVRMVNDKGVFLKESKRGHPGPAASFFKLFGLARLFPQSPVFAAYYAGHLKEDQEGEVDVLSGAYLMVRSALFRSLGGFDESFFMYAEDIDLSLRVKKAGYACYYFPAITILHSKGMSTQKDQVYVNRFYGAMSLFVKKYYGHQPLKSFFLQSGIRLRKTLARITGR